MKQQINSRSKQILCFTLSMLLLLGTLCAQPGQGPHKVKGVVKDATGATIPGVNIIEKGTTNGTTTDIEGRYEITVSSGASDLQFIYVGFTTTDKHVGNHTAIDVTLLEDQLVLSESVVVGYSTQAKKDITGSVVVIEPAKLLASTGSAAQQLQGKASGVQISRSGAPGGATTVRIRGVGTLNDNGPLYVIDGVSTRNQDLSSLSSGDIESMQILKDASSASIYGAQASNGVIIITTKKGIKTDQPVLKYDAYYGVSRTTKKYDVLNSNDLLNLIWDAQASAFAIRGMDKLPSHPQFGTGVRPKIPNLLTREGAQGATDIDPSTYDYVNNPLAAYSDTDWFDEVDRQGSIQNHQITLQGGTQKGQYLFSGNYYNEQGTVIESYYKKYTARMNTSYNVRDWLRVGENFSYTWSRDLGRTNASGEDQPYSWTYRSSPFVPVYDIQNNFAGSTFAGVGNFQGTVSSLKRNKDNYWSNTRIFANAFVEIDFMKNLTFRSNFGMDYGSNYSYDMRKKSLERSEPEKDNRFTEKSGFNFRTMWTNTVTYNKTFGDDHSLNLMAGTEAIKDGIGREMEASRTGYLFEDDINTWTLNMGANNNDRTNNSKYKGEFTLFGVFARADYAYKGKYLLTGIIRRDGVSRFSPSNRYGYFPSVSGGWRISNESFMEGSRSWLNDLKLRVGYGQTGNAQIPRLYNYAYEYLTDPRYTNYDLSGSNMIDNPGFKLSAYGNADTKWETTKMTNIGLDYSLLNGKFRGSIEWYNRSTSDMLVEAQYSALAGDATRPQVNFGTMRNRGFDANIDYHGEAQDWSWDVSLNFSIYKNKVMKLSNNDADYLEGTGDRFSTAVSRTIKGRSIGEFYGYNIVGFYESTADVLASASPLGDDKTNTSFNPQTWVGKFKYEDTNGDGRITPDDRKFLGSPHPDFITGLNLGAGYKGFDFSMFWYASVGNKMFNNTKYFTDFWAFAGNRSSRVRDLSWEPGKTNAILPILDYQDTKSSDNPSSYFIEDASFLRLKNVVIGYTLPRKWLEKLTIKNLRVYIQAENLITITGYSGLDPEQTNRENGGGGDLQRGIDGGNTPNVMRFVGGLSLTF